MNKKTKNGGSNHDRVSEKAFYLYQERVQKCSPGNELDDWLQAEKLVVSEVPDKKLAKPRVSRMKKSSSS